MSEAAHRYPGIDTGFDAALTPDDLLQAQSVIVSRIKLAAGGGDLYLRYYYPALRDLANWIHALPGNETANHFGAGGLLRLSLELSFHCLQIADQTLFARSEGSERRRSVESAWKFAAFLAGLYSELHIIPSKLQVNTRNGKTWPCYTTPLKQFLDEEGASTYFVRFLPSEMVARDASALIAHRLVRAEAIQYMQSAHGEIATTLFATISGKNVSHEYHKLADILDKVRFLVIEADRAIQPANYGKIKVGVHLEPHIIDAMRSLVRENRWRINESKQRLWYGADGLYIDWVKGTKDIVEILSARGIPGVPSNPETMSEVLFAAKIIEASSTGRLLWTCTPKGEEAPIDCVKIQDPRVVLCDLDFAPEKECIADVKPDPPKKSKKSPVPQVKDLFEDESVSDAINSSEGTHGELHDSQAEPVDMLRGEDNGPDNISSENHATEMAPNVIRASSPLSPLACDTSIEPSNTQDWTAGALAQPVELTLPEATEKLLRQLSNESTIEFFRNLITDIASKRYCDAVATPHGVGIPKSTVTLYGMDEVTLLTTLVNVGWMARDPQRPNAKYHKFSLDGNAEMFLVFKSVMADALGLKAYRNVDA